MGCASSKQLASLDPTNLHNRRFPVSQGGAIKERHIPPSVLVIENCQYCGSSDHSAWNCPRRPMPGKHVSPVVHTVAARNNTVHTVRPSKKGKEKANDAVDALSLRRNTAHVPSPSKKGKERAVDFSDTHKIHYIPARKPRVIKSSRVRHRFPEDSAIELFRKPIYTESN